MQAVKHYDIAIIGKGITGLSSAFHLRKSNHSLGFFADLSDLSTTAMSAQLICGGFIDNFTRISQRHNIQNAAAAWAYSNRAFDELKAFAETHDISFRIGQRVRLIETEDEKNESLKAVDQLQQSGFSSHCHEQLPPGASNLLAQQIDEPRAAWIDKDRLIEVLNEATQSIPTHDKVLKIDREKNHFVLRTATQSVHAEAVVLACHLGLRTLLPNLREVFIPSQDQWLRIQTKNQTALPFPVGTVLSWRHGHYWALVEKSHQLVLGGARFFRPLAGFEAEKKELSEKISKHLPEAWNKYFPDIKLDKVIGEEPGLDIRPCDEMPLIGPMFGDSGMFLAAGFMGQGLTLGFKAGQSLANIVLEKADDLPRFFWPERHRSLSINGE